MANNTILAMNALQSNIIREITPLSDKDCFYIAERYKTEFTYPIHNHAEFELNFTEKAAGVRRIVGDSAEVISDYDLVLITGKDLEHVWEQHDCHSKEIREITIQFSSDLFFKSFINKNQFDSIRDMLEKAQKGLCFPMSAILKIYPLLDTLASEKQGFYAVIKFLTILYELSLFNEEARTLSSSSFAKIGIHSDSRRVQKVQEYINAHYQEEIRLNQLADMPRVNIGLLHLLLQHTSASLSVASLNCVPVRIFRTISLTFVWGLLPACWLILLCLLLKSVMNAGLIIFLISIGSSRKRKNVRPKSFVKTTGRKRNWYNFM